MRITDRSLRGLAAKDQRYIVRDSTMPGFAVRVSPAGTKTFLYIYQLQGQRRWMTLGIYPDISLSDAHDLYDKARARKRRGEDPQAIAEEARHRRLTAPTVGDLADAYLEKYAKRFKKSWEEDARVLDKDVLPAWGSRKAGQIRRAEVLELLEEIGERGPVMANRTRALLSKMYRFGRERGLVARNPMDGIRDPFRETPRDRFLSAEEIKTFWNSLDDTIRVTEGVRTALRLILVTGQRPGEITGMTWEEIDDKWWTLPAERSKTGQTHRVYLSGLALELLGKAGKGFVFPSREGKPLDPRALSRALKRLEYFGLDPFKPHDLRRTCASHMAAAGIQPHIIDQVLAHRDSARRMLAVYNRHDYDPEKSRALTRWALELGRIIGWQEPEQNVIPFSG